MLDQQPTAREPPQRVASEPLPLTLRSAATMEADAVLDALGSSSKGLSSEQAARRLQQVGPNALVSHGARPLKILLNQFHNPLLILLISAPRWCRLSSAKRQTRSSS